MRRMRSTAESTDEDQGVLAIGGVGMTALVGAGGGVNWGNGVDVDWERMGVIKVWHFVEERMPAGVGSRGTHSRFVRDDLL